MMWATDRKYEGLYSNYLITRVNQETENEAVAIKETYSNYVLYDNSNNFILGDAAWSSRLR